MDPATLARLQNLYWSLGTIGFIVVGSLATGLIAQSVTRMRGRSLMTQRRAFWGYTLSAPWLLGFLIFVLGPSIASLYYSFTDYRLGNPAEWIGLENYRELLGAVGAHGRRFMGAMYNSFYYAVVGVPLQIVTALVMALLVAAPLRGMGVFRLIFYIPVILAGGPAILLAWRYMFASNGGFVNVTLRNLADAFPPFDWLYRSFIYAMEGFNAFFIGVTRNDAVGPLMYVLPALLGLLLALLLLMADEKGRRSIARTSTEILGALLLVLLAARLIAGGAVMPQLFQADHLQTTFRLLTMQSSIVDPGSYDYLRQGYSLHAMSPLWIVLLITLLTAFIGWGKPGTTARRWLLGGTAAVMLLLAAGSLVDGVRFFQSFDAAAEAAGSANHHFALFRQVTAQFPDQNRVPLWLSSELWSKPSLILITMWSSGAAMLIFLAALKGVPRSFYEAADVDGASTMQKFWRITLPLISPALFYNVVIGLIAALQTFEAVYLIQNTQTEQTLSSAAYFLFVRTFRQLEIGQGAAASWILAVIIVLLTVLQFRFSRWVHYD